MIRPLDGKSPRIHPSAFVAETAYIVGDVTIGENTSIWPGAVIRADYGDIIIGKNCSIQDNCVLHTDDHLELGDNVLMTHGAVVHGGKVGDNVLIGVNAVVLEDGDVGDHVFIGAGAIVRGRVEPNSLVIGVPGKARPLSEAQAERLKNPTARYVQNGKRFIDQGLGQDFSEYKSEG
ncbi:MAG TPA: gamma carbonic anhydrase family protein [Dehalococcoidia bacterium]|mgnify:FL=1|nr:gamma carbonic anhydrase family protein [SAR202 cluster bacterium]HAA96060.1 gamma carbonic anhydrase family protein [Dehalococcoidia bacterium]HCL26651.1 gamma carbonic anhydrase family protein [Dehalococcoidia bacterium]